MAVHTPPVLIAEADSPDRLEAREPIPLSSWFALAAMMFATIYATVDRQIFILFAQAIKEDLQLSDTQLGVLQGVGLTLVGLITVYPISWIADRRDRRKVVAACIAIWSLAVLGCAFSPNFILLLLFASLVGIGEAGVAPSGLAMVPDLFPKSARQLANSVFAIGGRLAGALGIYLAGLLIVLVELVRPFLPPALASLHEWRLAFLMTVAFAPLAVMSILLLPKRAAGTPAVKPDLADAVDSLEAVWPFLKRHRQAWTITMTAALFMAFGTVATAGWVPVIAQRYFGQTPQSSGEWMATLGLISGIAGFAIGVPIMQRLQQRIGLRMPIYVLSICLLLQGLIALAMGFARDVPQLYILWGVQATIGMVAAMAIPTILQNMAPVHLRARIFAISSFVGMAGAISYVAVGFISDQLTDVVTYPLLYSAAALGFAGLCIGAFLFWRSQALYESVARETNA